MQSCTIKDLQEMYLANNKRISWSTAELTKRAFKYLIKSIGNMELKYMTVEHAEQFQLWLMNRYSNTTVNINTKIVRPAFRYAMRREWIKEDLFSIPLLKVTEERERIYEPQEIERILEAANQIWKLRILLAYSCGLRRAEVLNLNYSDCDFTRKLIHIQPKKETQGIWAWEPKGRTCRTLPMPEKVGELLMSQKKDLPPYQPYPCLSEVRYWSLKKRQRDNELTERNRLVPDENFGVPFRKILRRADVAYGTFHDLRRTYGTMMAEAGIPQHELAFLMGHSDSKTTEKFYIRLRRQHTVERARRLSPQPYTSRGDWLRSSDLTAPSRALYQTELHPEKTTLLNGA